MISVHGITTHTNRKPSAAGHPPYAYASSYVDRVRFDGDLMGIIRTPVRSQRTTAGSSQLGIVEPSERP